MKSQTELFRIIIADDHTLFRLGLRKLIEENPNWRVVAEASNGLELLEKIKENECDLIIMDLSMPELSGIDALTIIRKKRPELKILVLSMHKEREFVRKVFSKNVEGYILKDDVFEKLTTAIKSIREGRKSYSDKITEFIMDDYSTIQENEQSLDILTKREREILRLIVDGQSNKEIAHSLDISIRTVEAHRANLMEKLGINNVQALVKFAIEKGVI